MFTTRVLIAQNRYLKGERSFPVDYIRMDLKIKNTVAEQAALFRKNLLKNVVMRLVVEGRERKKRPKLGEVLSVYRRKKHEPNAKEAFQEKFIKLYGSEENNDDE